jgi:hypothetical protein
MCAEEEMAGLTVCLFAVAAAAVQERRRKEKEVKAVMEDEHKEAVAEEAVAKEEAEKEEHGDLHSKWERAPLVCLRVRSAVATQLLRAHACCRVLRDFRVSATLEIGGKTALKARKPRRVGL